MTLLLSAAQMRAVDQAIIATLGLPGLVLMENAGRGVAEIILKEARARWGKRSPAVCVICGSGQNGGDGFVVARALASHGMKVRVCLAGNPEKITGDAAVQAKVLRGLFPDSVVDLSGETSESAWLSYLGGAEVVVDAIFGTGLRAPPEGAARAAILAMNASPALRVSVDLPSGLDANTGRDLGLSVNAEITATIACPKLGLWLNPRAAVGRIAIVDFGVQPEAMQAVAEAQGPLVRLLDEAGTRGRLPKKMPSGHKGTAGHLLVIAGSVGKTGAALLAGRAGLRAGAGLVTLASTRSGQAALDPKVLAEMTACYAAADDADDESYAALAAHAPRMRATAVGPGIPTGSGMKAMLFRLLAEWPLPLVVDADALTLLGSALPEICAQAKAPRILTPHPGEMGRLLDMPTAMVEEDRLGSARSLAHAAQAVVVLKGARTLVALPTGEVFVNPHANASLGTAGSGDVLTGIMGGFLAQGLSPEDAATAAVFVHGMAAEIATVDLGSRNLIAADLPEAVAKACERLLSV